MGFGADLRPRRLHAADPGAAHSNRDTDSHSHSDSIPHRCCDRSRPSAGMANRHRFLRDARARTGARRLRIRSDHLRELRGPCGRQLSVCSRRP